MLVDSEPKKEIVDIQEYIVKQARIFALDEVKVLNIAKCESALKSSARGDFGASRGIWQIHSGYHPEITDQQAFDVEWSTKWALTQMKAGRWNWWTCSKKVIQS